MIGASWLPLPAALSVGALQISGAAGLFAGQILSLAALEAAVAFGVASAVMLVYRRSTFGRPVPQSGAPMAPGSPPAAPAAPTTGAGAPG